MSPLVMVVLPAPRSPDSISNTGGLSCAANLRPISTVSSGEREKNSVSGTVPLPNELRECRRQRVNQIGGHHGCFADAFGGQIAGQPVQIDCQSQDALP